MMRQRKPDWLKIKIQDPKKMGKMNALLHQLSLHTVCQEANCPNKMECYQKGTATFMILGNVCTRNCRFCNVTEGAPQPLDWDEAQRIGEAVKTLSLAHVVITSVTRDDLADGGAQLFAQCITKVQESAPRTTVEVLIPDFQGNKQALEKVLEARPDILNHNVETIPRLYEKARPMANYRQSLEVLSYTKQHFPDIFTKSGMMVGLGETKEEVVALLKDLREVGCDIVTIGQYLAPSIDHLEVVEYIPPEVFQAYEKEAYALGFQYVASGPFVRSSYYAEKFIQTQK